MIAKKNCEIHIIYIDIIKFLIIEI